MLENRTRIRILLWSVAMISVWIFLWFWPWQLELQGSVWLRLGMALFIFIIPGLSVYGLLTSQQGHWGNYITFGFVISHLIVACAVTMGRVIHVSFDLVKDFTMTLGILLFLVYTIPIVSSGISFRVNRNSLKYIASACPLLLVSLLVSLIVIQRELSDDDLTYLAFITNSQFSTHLNFNDVLFGIPQSTVSRYLLVSAPFTQAFLAELGRIPGILMLGGYYEPFLVIIFVLCWYELARTLHFSHLAASISVILHLSFLLLLSEYLHPGAPFFNQLNADKATASYIIYPLFILSEFWWIRQPTKKNFILFFLVGLSLTFMHPVALAYSVIVGCVLFVLNISRSTPGTRIGIILIFFIILAPHIAFRFVGTPIADKVPYGLESILSQDGIEKMISLWGNTPFYGFNPDILVMKFPYQSQIPFLKPVFEWGWLLVPLLALVISVRELSQSDAAQFIFSGFLLCALAGIPFTGFILGYFLSAWMLERALWLFPFGISTILLLSVLRDKTIVGQRMSAWMLGLRKKSFFSNVYLIIIAFSSSVLILLFLQENGLTNFSKFGNKIRRYEDIAMVGRFLDRQISDQAVAIGSDGLNDLIPGISSKAKLVTFRTSDFSNMPLFTPDEIKERITDGQTIFSNTASPKTKLDLLKKYNIRFLLLKRSDYDYFADFIASYPSMLTTKVGRFIVVEIR